MGNLHYIPVSVTAEVTNNGESFSSWDNTNSYKPFTIVEYQGDFYLSIDNVPASTAISNTSYWYKISGSSSPSPSSIAWGNITGTLSNQTDLQSALNDKADTSSLATVATTGDYTDLSNTPNLAAVATSGAYSDLSGTPNLAAVATSGDYSDLNGTPNLAPVATSGAYSDLSGTPNLSWQYVDNFNSTAKEITIGECNEIMFVAHVYNNAMKVSAIFPPSEITASTWYKIGGAYRTSSTNLDVEMEVVSVSGSGASFKPKFSMSAAYVNGGNRASTSSIYVYKR